MFDRLPTPWGLVRLGVAPDHPKIKSVSRAFERIAQRPGFRFFGNVEVGRDLAHDELTRALRRGRLRLRRAGRPADGHSRRGPPGLVARDRVRRLVQRPPGLPGSPVRPLRRSGPSSSGTGTSRSTWRGCSRSPPRRSSRPTRRTRRSPRSSARGSAEILVLGRRGPAQAAFTTPELQELTELAGADLVDRSGRSRARPGERGGARGRHGARAAQRRPAARGGRQRRRRASRSASSCASASRRSRSSATSRVEAVEVVRNELVAGRERDASAPSRPSEREVIPCGLVLRSVGYRGTAMPGRPVRRGPRDDPERRRPRPRRRRRADPGRLLHRLDQARPERRHRHEQEGRDRDGRAAARGLRGRDRLRATGATTRCGRRRPRRARRRRRHLRGLGGDRRRRVRARRAAGAPARQAAPLGRAARRGPQSACEPRLPER